MRISYIGLGKMGHSMVLRLIEKGHRVAAYDVDPAARKKIARAGAQAADSIKELVAALAPPRTVWIMVPAYAKASAGKPPASPVDEVLRELKKYLKRGDTVIEGGNSYYKDSARRAKKITARGIRFLDVGVSGGPKGARKGACLMIGGDRRDYRRLAPLFRDLSVKGGYSHMGGHGAGHFVKMVHNGIEYGMMQAIAEGFDLMQNGPYRLDLIKIANLYNHGSVVESRLVGWLEGALREFGPGLKKISGSVGATGEGEWTVMTAKKFGVPAPVIKAALGFRRRSKKNPSYAGKLLSGMRNQFGGHSVK